MIHSLGFIGLGKMGKNMVLRLVEQDISVVVYNRTVEKAMELRKELPSISIGTTVEEFVAKLQAPRVIWLMVPNGAPVDEMLESLRAAGIGKGDTIIDGGNTYYKDTVRRHDELAKAGIAYIDCGTSGGLSGARNGACLMVGGDKEAVESLNWLWTAASIPGGFTHFGPSGAGHFVKMVHNGVEYGMNQAIAEGFELLHKSPYSLELDLVAKNWSHGSVVRGWLMELLSNALAKDPQLDAYTGIVGGGQTGTWTQEAAKELDVPTPVLNESLNARKSSQLKPSFAGKVVSALRAGYGGHKEPGK